ncbi:MAG: UbiX family flavin prenyltransferase [Bacteroidales bacterium]|jgi:4-hydroxy-3-polyprenylbenzoate decarboxylase|nr:UbiX family flavin prenyltransferase [Bacteroidales bacterium]
MKKKIVIAITGASGAIYAQSLIEKLEQSEHVELLSVVMSEVAKQVWETEIGTKPNFTSKQYQSDNFYAPFASGSSVQDSMIILPCTMGTMAKIAGGIADNLITRAADVFLKEKKQLIIVPRETPFNLIHVRNMEQLILAGAQIIPASPSFYANPKSIDDLVSHFTDRILDQLSIPTKAYRWGSEK